MRLVPRTVTMRVPVTSSGIIYANPATTLYPPAPRVPVRNGTKVESQKVESKKAETPTQPTPPKPDEELTPATGEKKAGQEEADKQPMLPAKEGEKKDGDANGPALGNAAGDKGA
jgi:hypothetical protein